MNGVDEVSLQRVLQQFEHEIIGVNRQNIKDIAGDIGKNEILKLGEAISLCRARYLESILKMANAENSEAITPIAKEVKSQRLLYEESMLGFAALRHALERGYIVITDD